MIHALLCRDVSALFMEQIMLYRDTRDSILAGAARPEAWAAMPPAARERALQQEMKADCNLHPALYPLPPEGSAAVRGHYRVRGCRGLLTGSVQGCGDYKRVGAHML